MRARCAKSLVSWPDECVQSQLIGHTARRGEDRCRFSDGGGGLLLERIHGWIFSVDVVSDFGLGHRTAHLRRWPGHRIGPKIRGAICKRHPTSCFGAQYTCPALCRAMPVVGSVARFFSFFAFHIGACIDVKPRGGSGFKRKHLASISRHRRRVRCRDRPRPPLRRHGPRRRRRPAREQTRRGDSSRRNLLNRAGFNRRRDPATGPFVDSETHMVHHPPDFLTAAPRTTILSGL
ncbi:hypothetical protein BMS3Bbin01_02975 [bacterium BMS3Bbin01]|nr:hypothetical protein BMS3Bbin01_02975 [bacterium BMS3Bbin01]